VLRLVGGG